MGHKAQCTLQAHMLAVECRAGNGRLEGLVVIGMTTAVLSNAGWALRFQALQLTCPATQLAEFSLTSFLPVKMATRIATAAWKQVRALN
eukprot:700368-Amphidinium_carterae.1